MVGQWKPAGAGGHVEAGDQNAGTPVSTNPAHVRTVAMAVRALLPLLLVVVPCPPRLSILCLLALSFKIVQKKTTCGKEKEGGVALPKHAAAFQKGPCDVWGGVGGVGVSTGASQAWCVASKEGGAKGNSSLKIELATSDAPAFFFFLFAPLHHLAVTLTPSPTTPHTSTGHMEEAVTPAAAAKPASEVERLLQRLGGGFPPEVARLTNQLLRKLAVKCKPGSLGKCEVCRPAVCVELACRQCGHLGVSRDALVQQSMVKETLYRDVFRRVETALELTSAWSVPQMAMVLGGEQAVKLAERTLTEYQARYSNSLQDGGRGGGQARPFAQQSLYVAAAFFLATKKLKVRLCACGWNGKDPKLISLEGG